MRIEQEAVQYDLDALKKNVDRCKANIAVFQEAISKEYREITHLQAMIAVLEKRRRR